MTDLRTDPHHHQPPTTPVSVEQLTDEQLEAVRRGLVADEAAYGFDSAYATIYHRRWLYDEVLRLRAALELAASPAPSPSERRGGDEAETAPDRSCQCGARFDEHDGRPFVCGNFTPSVVTARATLSDEQFRARVEKALDEILQTNMDCHYSPNPSQDVKRLAAHLAARTALLDLLGDDRKDAERWAFCRKYEVQFAWNSEANWPEAFLQTHVAYAFFPELSDEDFDQHFTAGAPTHEGALDELMRRVAALSSTGPRAPE